jgi:riboflavin biosynthesis pyrimidine reductase
VSRPNVTPQPWNPDALDVLYAWPNQFWTRGNLVTSESGDVRGTTGTSRDLTSPQDRQILRLVRAEAEILIVGAASLRAEGWHLPPAAHVYVLSASGNVPWDTCPDRSRVDLVVPEPQHSLEQTVDELMTSISSTAVTRVLCEGGPRLLTALVSLGYLNELCLTVVSANVADVTRSANSLLRGARTWAATSLMTGTQPESIFSIWRCVTE